MKPITFYALAGATVVAVIAAAVAATSQRAPTRIAADRPLAFPEAAKRANDVAEIVIRSGREPFTIRRNGEVWGIVEKGGYPVSFERVKTTIVALGNLRLLEQKTSDAERYARLQLEDPAGADAKSRLVVMKDGTGKEIASAVVGRRNTTLFGANRGGTYIRRGTEAGSWLAEGDLEVGATPNDWMEREIVDVASDRIARAVVTHPDGEKTVVRKDVQNQPAFTVDDIPEGRKLKTDNEGGTVAGAIWRLRLEDVKPAKDLAAPAAGHVVRFETFDGLNVTVRLSKIEEEYWATFEAAADPPAPAADKPATDPAKAEDAKNDPVKAAADLNARVKGWAYRLSNWDAEKMTKKVADLLDDKPAAGKS
ncbi:MAG: DUF4340 domain-containing protein [Alphaproteobacteria bacterium]|nr:DUF4340 domain-containing protein [Alphaproteobacteria bacterium]